MHTELPETLLQTEAGKLADTILRKCVHCGFCTATCPTYQITGSELDSPRGRIYQIKQVLEGAPATREIQTHLDRCLTCRNCETTCPSGVHYSRLLDIGREVVEKQVGRTPWEKVQRETLRRLMLNKPLFHYSYRTAQHIRGILPKALRSKVLPTNKTAPERAVSSVKHTRQVIVPKGCVQPTMMPDIDAASLLVLDRLGLGAIVPEAGGCCGAINLHMNEHEKSLADMRRNIDAWWPYIEAGAEAIVSNASGCGVMIKDYGFHLAHDPQYAEKARRVGELAKDIVEIIQPEIAQLSEKVAYKGKGKVVAYHPPCTLQHGQKIRGKVEEILSDLGYTVLLPKDSHLCCGSAGTYSVMHPELSKPLRDNKLRNLHELNPSVILSANIGCIGHLASGTDTPVRHWIEFVADAL